MERKTKAELNIDATVLIENLSNGAYEKTPDDLQNLKINFITDADTEFETIIALLQEKELSRHVRSLKVRGDRDESVKLSKLSSNIGTLTALTLLDVSANQLTTLAGIEQLQALTALLAPGNQLTTLAGIEQLKALTTLDVGYNQLTTLAGIEHLKALITLGAVGNQLTTLAGIEQLKALRMLYVSYNQLTTLAGIEQLKALTTLYVSDNQLTTLAGIEQLKALTTLVASHNKLTKLPISLGNCVALERLEVSGNPLTPRTIEELRTQFLNLQKAYRRSSEIENLLDDSMNVPPMIKGIIFEYDNIPISENAELNSLAAEELDILKKSISTEKNKDAKTQKKIDDVKIITGLYETIKKDSFEEFQKLLSEAQSMSVNLDIKTGDAGYTLLHAAILNNASSEFTRVLLKNGANPNQPDRNGLTPVATAAVRGNHEILAVYQRHVPQEGQKFFVPITLETWKNAARLYNNIKDENPNGEINYKEVRDILDTVLKGLGIVLDQPTKPAPLIIHTPKEKPDNASEQKIQKEDPPNNKKITP